LITVNKKFPVSQGLRRLHPLATLLGGTSM
jgi:hypothetical protein